MLNLEYLTSKIPVENGVNAGSTNISRLSDDVFSFTEYNLLPGSGVLDGHYTFFVNVANFEYLLYKSSDYGGLTWTRRVKFKKFMRRDDLCDQDAARCDAIVASKLSGAYFYDGSEINGRGKNLVAGCETKRSLISDYRGYVWSGSKPNEYSPEQLAALRMLVGFRISRKKLTIMFAGRERTRTRTFIEVGSGKNKDKIYGWIYRIPVKYGKDRGHILRMVGPLNQRWSVMFIGEREVCRNILNHDFREFVRILPEALANYADLPKSKS